MRGQRSYNLNSFVQIFLWTDKENENTQNQERIRRHLEAVEQFCTSSNEGKIQNVVLRKF